MKEIHPKKILEILEVSEHLPKRDGEKASQPRSEVLSMVGIFDSTGFVEPFDWPAWLEEIGPEKLTDLDFLKNADLETLRKLMTAHHRTERFNQGHLNALHEGEYMTTYLNRLKELNSQSDLGSHANSTSQGDMIFSEIPQLPQSWWTDPPTSDPAIVWTVWDKNTYYLWGANSGNYQQGPIGSLIGGGGMAGTRGPTRGRQHPHYLGVITMDSTQMPNNGSVFLNLSTLVSSGKNVVVPVYKDSSSNSPAYKFSLGTGIGASQPHWDDIQKVILSFIYLLGKQCGNVQIPTGVYWPDCRTTKPYTQYPIQDLDDIKNIVDNVLST